MFVRNNTIRHESHEYASSLRLAQETVISIHYDFNNVVSLIAPGLASIPDEPLRWAGDQLIGGLPLVYYNNSYYMLAANSYHFPHITTTGCVRNEFNRVFTEHFIDIHLYPLLFYGEAPYYINIDGLLHRRDVDFPSMWNWIYESIEIINITYDSFTAIVPRVRQNDELDTMRMEFIYTPNGWRIDDIGFVYFETFFRLNELEHFIFTLLNSSNNTEIIWTIAILDEERNIITTVGNIYSPIIEQSYTIVNRNGQSYMLQAISSLYAQEKQSSSIYINIAHRNGSTICMDTLSYAFNIANKINEFINGRSVDNRFFVAIDDINYLINLNHGIVYFGRPTCPACRQIVPQLFSIANGKQTRVYYFNTDRWRGNNKFADVLSLFEVGSVPYMIEITGNELIIIDDLYNHLYNRP